jgi:hypothetical protein
VVSGKAALLGLFGGFAAVWVGFSIVHIRLALAIRDRSREIGRPLDPFSRAIDPQGRGFWTYARLIADQTADAPLHALLARARRVWIITACCCGAVLAASLIALVV